MDGERAGSGGRVKGDRRRAVWLGLLIVALLAACGGIGDDAASSTEPSTVATEDGGPGPSGVADSKESAESAGPTVGSTTSAAASVCDAIRAVQADLDPSTAVAAAYQAQFVLKVVDSLSEDQMRRGLADEDAAVATLCPEAYLAFLEQADISSLAEI